MRRAQKGLRQDEDLVLDESDWMVYWLDGHSFHLTMHTSKLSDLNKVLLYCFKAHSSRVCQPNDVGPFKLLKAHWMSVVAQWRVNHPFEILTRAEFAEMLDMALSKLNSECIVSEFRVAALYPFDVNAMKYDKLTEIGRRRYKNIRNGGDEVISEAKSCTEELTLYNIEPCLSADIVRQYNEFFKLPLVCMDDLLPLNAYLLGAILKEKQLMPIPLWTLRCNQLSSMD